MFRFRLDDLENELYLVGLVCFYFGFINPIKLELYWLSGWSDEWWPVGWPKIESSLIALCFVLLILRVFLTQRHNLLLQPPLPPPPPLSLRRNTIHRFTFLLSFTIFSPPLLLHFSSLPNLLSAILLSDLLSFLRWFQS